ncbi:hypothetical protein, partial [Actinomadura darangshiensis]|uniref:hypothetical protein n=1 Tax=Actinomadura darangshiensis TaxID=705336 RepID=UPI001A9EB3B2
MVEQRRQEAEQDQVRWDDDGGQGGHEPGGHPEQDEQDRVRHAQPPGQGAGRQHDDGDGQEDDEEPVLLHGHDPLRNAVRYASRTPPASGTFRPGRAVRDASVSWRGGRGRAGRPSYGG